MVDSGVEGFSNAYAIIGFSGMVLFVLTLLIALIWRSNPRAKEDSTPKLLEVVSDSQKINQKWADEISADRQSRAHESTANVQALTAIATGINENSKVTAALADVVQSVNRAVTDARADITALASTQATRDAALQGEVLTAITTAQTAIIAEFSALMVDAIKELKTVILQLRYRRDTSKPVHKIINRLDAKIDQLSKDVKDYAKSQANSPIPPATPVIGAIVPSDASKPLYAPVSTGDAIYAPTAVSTNGRYPDANRWLRDGDK